MLCVSRRLLPIILTSVVCLFVRFGENWKKLISFGSTYVNVAATVNILWNHNYIFPYSTPPPTSEKVAYNCDACRTNVRCVLMLHNHIKSRLHRLNVHKWDTIQFINPFTMQLLQKGYKILIICMNGQPE